MSKIRVLKSSYRFCHLWVERTASTNAEALETLGIVLWVQLLQFCQLICNGIGHPDDNPEMVMHLATIHNHALLQRFFPHLKLP
jgi:hypothetical protein